MFERLKGMSRKEWKCTLSSHSSPAEAGVSDIVSGRRPRLPLVFHTYQNEVEQSIITDKRGQDACNFFL